MKETARDEEREEDQAEVTGKSDEVRKNTFCVLKSAISLTQLSA